MIGYDLLLGHAAPPPIHKKAMSRKVVATEMVRSVERAEQRERNGELFQIAARNRARILKFLRAHGPVSKGELCDALDITDDQFKRATATLREQGLIHLHGSRRNAQWMAAGGRE